MRLSSRELAEWIAYNSIEPIGRQRADLRSGMIAAVVANCHRDPKKSKAFSPQDFMPFAEREEKPTGEQLRDQMRAFAEQWNEQQERKQGSS